MQTTVKYKFKQQQQQQQQHTNNLILFGKYGHMNR